MHDLNLRMACKIANWEHLGKRTYEFTACTESAAAFQMNMERVNGLLMLPGYAFTSGGEWQVAVKAVAERYFGKDMPSDEEFEEKREKIAALANAARKSVLSRRPAESSMNVFYTACYNIEVFAGDFPRLHGWLHDIFKSAIIQSWTAFEVLAEDLNCGAREKHFECFPSNVLTGKRFTSRRLDSLCESFRRAFCGDAHINAVVGSKEVKALALLRHLLVHKGGFVDRQFLNQCSGDPVVNEFSTLGLNQEIKINGGMVRSLVDPCIRRGYELVKLVDDWMTAHKPR
jgi:hypothetical protein